MDKPWLDYHKQVSLLVERGLHVDDEDAVATFLSKVSYYRLSGYFRYWQIAPADGDDRFLPGSSFTTIERLYAAEQALLMVLDEVLHPIEVLLRTRFAYYYAKKVGATNTFPRGEGLTQPPDTHAMRVEEYALSDLDRSKESFVSRYRQGPKVGSRYGADTYATMPIWVAVEAFSFGSLSRLIEASGQSGVLAALARSLEVSPRTLPSQVRSFVYLRNRVAHCARLWNHSVLDVPGLLPNVSRRAKREHRQFSDHSVYKILIALDLIATRSGRADTWLSSHVDPLLESNPLLCAGITSPTRYGNVPRHLLV